MKKLVLAAVLAAAPLAAPAEIVQLDDKTSTVSGRTATVVNTLTTQVCTFFGGQYSGGMQCVLLSSLPKSSRDAIKSQLARKGASFPE